MKIFFLLAAVGLASVFAHDQNQSTIYTSITINNVSLAIYDHIKFAHLHNELRISMREHLRLYTYFPHNFTPRIEENPSFHLSDKSLEMINDNQCILFNAVSIPPYKPLLCVIVGLNKKQAEDVAFKSLLYDLNMSIIKPQLKEFIYGTTI